jgi:hypothetical protein
MLLTFSTYAYIQQDKNMMNQDNTLLVSTTDINNAASANKELVNTQNTKGNDVTITVTWKNKSYRIGTEVPLHYTVINNGKNTVYDVEAYTQDLENHIVH